LDSLDDRPGPIFYFPWTTLTRCTVGRCSSTPSIPIRSEHSALNTLLQSAGAILCKQWVRDSYDALIAAGFKWGWDGDFVFLGWIHDELQIACRKEIAERVGELVTAAANAAGRPFTLGSRSLTARSKSR
jgi:hypothetical protein